MLLAAAPAPIPASSSHSTIYGIKKLTQTEPVPQLPEEGNSTSSVPIVALGYDTITDSVAARLAISLIGHVLFLKSQIPLPIVQLSKLSSSKSTTRAVKQRNELLSSFDTVTSHLNTTFTALSSAFARINSTSKRHNDDGTNNAQSDHARAYMGVFIGSSPATAKAKVLFAVDGLEIKAIGARDDVVRVQEGSDRDDDDLSGSEEDIDDGEDSDEIGDPDDDDNSEEDDDEEETEETDEEEDDDGDDGSSLPPESRSPSPEPSYPSHAEQQRVLQVAERLFSRTLAAADANGNGMSAELAPTQTHILLRAPRRFNHPAWIPRQNFSATLESALDEFLEESGISKGDVQGPKTRKASKKGKSVEGVWVVGRAGLNTALGKDTVRGSDNEWDEMIWWSWDGKIVGFSDW